MFAVGPTAGYSHGLSLVYRSGIHACAVFNVCISRFPVLHAGMIGGSTSRPSMPSGEWAPQSPAVRVTCAATTGAMSRPVQGGMIRNPAASIPMRAGSQPGQRQMLQSQVMNIGKLLTRCSELRMPAADALSAPWSFQDRLLAWCLGNPLV